MRLPIAVLLCAALGAGFSAGVAAAGKGDKGASANGGTPAPGSRAMQNSNGRFVEDREFGKDRAAERKAIAAQKKRQLPPQPRELPPHPPVPPLPPEPPVTK